MKEHPILFGGDMVRAILEGRKTQTRRVVKLPKARDPRYNLGWADWIVTKMKEVLHITLKDGAPWDTASGPSKAMQDKILRCPYGFPGDRLWVRETFGFPEAGNKDAAQNLAKTYRAVWYRATDPYGSAMKHGPLRSLHWDRRWRPSIHMPRWASRLTLEVVSIRVERLQEITWQDALAEGIEPTYCCGGFECGCQGLPVDNPVHDFQDLWDSINAKRGHGWDMNPWVWVVGFKPEEPPHAS